LIKTQLQVCRQIAQCGKGAVATLNVLRFMSEKSLTQRSK